MELHCQWGLSKLNLSQSSKFLGEKCVYSSVKFLSVYPTDLYSIYYVERWLKCTSYQKLLSFGDDFNSQVIPVSLRKV